MNAHLEELLDSLLYEGYALYPYTPAATKNATPTPFGIVYPPRYAAETPGAFSFLQLECMVEGGAAGTLSALVAFLRPSGEGHRASPDRIELDVPGERAFDGGRVRLERADDRVRLRLENTTPVDPGLTRRDALQSALVSTHALVRVDGARFVSPLDAVGCVNVNTWPVLASPEDDTVLGAAIVLPDHPQIAHQSRGNLFDGTEIEEALLLHVHALSDGERAALEAQDSVVRTMLERAETVSSDDLFALHAAMRPVADPREGEPEVVVGGVTFRRGASVVLRPARVERDPYDRMLDGRVATIERIYRDVDGRVYLGVTVDSDPMRDVLRESGRYLFFFVDEVELVA